MNYSEVFCQYAVFTQARINLGNAGSGIPTKPLLAFRYDHAIARDAVNTKLNCHELQQELLKSDLKSIVVHSQAPDRITYLKRPDLGRKLRKDSVELLQTEPQLKDIVFIIADGLSARAVQSYAVTFLQCVCQLLADLTYNKIIIAEEARVALSDEIGELLKASLSIILIGERPGLSSSDSMGIYHTFDPKVGTTDEKRNCISNIRSQGLSIEDAAFKLNYFIRESLVRKLSGTHLKDEQSLSIE